MSLLLKDVTKRYGNFTAVENLTLEIPANEIYGFLGGNGAGKTTTFRMILGLLNYTSGSITWKGEQITYGMSPFIGYLPEERGLYPKLTVKEQLIYLGRLRKMNKNDVLKELKKWLERFKITSYLNKRVEELSKGNQQKIQFISAVIHQPELLILDEPFSGLDPINVDMLKKAVVDLNEQGTSIVFSSHQMDHVETLCENVCILHQGKDVVRGALTDIKESFGKKNLMILADFSMDFLSEFPGVTFYHRVKGGCKVQIKNEAVSQDILAVIQAKGFIRKFTLEEPSLNDIFLEKVGEVYA